MYLCVYIITTTHTCSNNKHTYTHTQCYLLLLLLLMCECMYVHRARQSLLLLATIEFRLCFYIFYFSKYIIFRISILLAARSLSRARAAE